MKELTKKDVIVTLHGLSNFRRIIDEITENKMGAELALHENGTEMDERICAALLCLMRIGQLSQEASELIAEAIEG